MRWDNEQSRNNIAGFAPATGLGVRLSELLALEVPEVATLFAKAALYY